MILKISLIFLVTFTAETTLGSIWNVPIRANKINLTNEEKKEIQDNVSDFIEYVTLNETTTIWHNLRFQFCFNRESFDYNFVIFNSKKEITNHLKNYWIKSKFAYEHLIDEIKDYSENLHDLIDEARIQVFLNTQEPGFDDEKVKLIVGEIKKKIEEYLIGIHQNIFSIQKSPKSNSPSKNWTETKEKFIKEMEKIKKASIKFIADIKTCISAKE